MSEYSIMESMDNVFEWKNAGDMFEFKYLLTTSPNLKWAKWHIFICYKQDNQVNLLHIESRKSRRRNSELEVLVDCDSDRETLKDIVQLLRKQTSIIAMDSPDKFWTPVNGTVLYSFIIIKINI